MAIPIRTIPVAYNLRYTTIFVKLNKASWEKPRARRGQRRPGRLRYTGPVRILLILCHPQAGSFNHAVADRARETLAAAGHQVFFHDLYQEGFDPVLTGPEYRRGVSVDEQVVRHTKELEACGGLVFVHPEWWGQPPALLKGWVDRVLRPGVAYEPAGEELPEREPAPLLGDKAALVLATRDAGARSGLLDAGAAGLLERVWLEGVFAFCGIRNAACHVLHDLRRLGPAERQAWLAQAGQALLGMFPPVQGPGTVQASRPAR